MNLVRYALNFAIFVTFTDAEEQMKVFSNLAKEGTITMPLPDSSSDTKFGMLIDKFGIQWMLVWNEK